MVSLEPLSFLLPCFIQPNLSPICMGLICIPLVCMMQSRWYSTSRGPGWLREVSKGNSYVLLRCLPGLLWADMGLHTREVKTGSMLQSQHRGIWSFGEAHRAPWEAHGVGAYRPPRAGSKSAPPPLPSQAPPSQALTLAPKDLYRIHRI